MKMQSMIKRIGLACALLLLPVLANAQQATFTYPVTGVTSSASGTIAVTNTFQSLQASNPPHSSTQHGRLGCLVQNNGTNSMWVYFGDIAGATKGKSVVLAAGQGVSCATSAGGILTDQVSITGTSGDAFYAGFQ